MLAQPTPALTSIVAAGNGGDVALIARSRRVTFDELRELVAQRVGELSLPQRSVVLLHGRTSLDLVLGYLAIHHAGHVPLLAANHPERLAATWRPAAVVTAGHAHDHHDRRSDGHGGWHVERTGAAQPDLHPDLALLMSTSGSTGSPKLVRLSHDNVRSNARAIAESLRLTPADRGITSLPLHYCYGLSVLHSHLAAGAGVVLTDASVVDPCFHAALVDHGVTNVAGVPHTFELLERAGPDRLAVPTLRYLTVAGGRMAPEAVERWAARAAGWGADFYVMYGQTEATARMAYLPPALAPACPDAIGVPIPGGELRVDAPEGAVGELVYRGPNVMLGYATEPAHLALGATLDELRTGDLGRYDAHHGVFHVVGRRSRFVKPFGVRIDLDALEVDLRAELALGELAVAGDDDSIAVLAPAADLTEVRRWVAERTGLPDTSIAVAGAAAVPRTPSGKVDHAAVRELVHAAAPPPPSPTRDRSVADAFAIVLGRRHVRPGDTFVSLGGDSLAYVECSIRLERTLGRLPADWHLLTVDELERHRALDAPDVRPRWRQTARLDSTVLLRAIGICTIVATHMHVTYYPGGAHLLLALVGYNLSRFMLPIDDARDRARAGLRTVWRTAGPVVAWVAAGMVLMGAYSTGTLLLVNTYVGPHHHRGGHWHFWFIEVLAHLVLIVTALVSIPAVRRAERRWPYAFVLGVLAVTLLFRYGVIDLLNPDQTRFRTHGTAFFFALGWLIHRSRTSGQRLATSAICAVVIWDYFGFAQREQFIITCLVALVWLREITVPQFAVAPVALVSTSSLWILITHFSVWPTLVDHLGTPVAYPLTIATGVAAWAVVRVTGVVARRARGWVALPGRGVVGRRASIVRMA